MTSLLGYTRLVHTEEIEIGGSKIKAEVICEVIKMKCLSGGEYVSVGIVSCIVYFSVTGPEGRVSGTLSITAIYRD